MMTEIELLTEAEAAAALRLKPRMLREFRQRGLIGYRKMGRLVRYARTDLEKFVEESLAGTR